MLTREVLSFNQEQFLCLVLLEHLGTDPVHLICKYILCQQSPVLSLLSQQNSVVLANDSDENQEQHNLLLPQKQSVIPV